MSDILVDLLALLVIAFLLASIMLFVGLAIAVWRELF